MSNQKTKDEGPPIITAVKNYEVNKHTNMHPQKPQTTFRILSPLKQVKIRTVQSVFM